MRTRTLPAVAALAFTAAGLAPLAGQASPPGQDRTFTAPRFSVATGHAVEVILYNPERLRGKEMVDFGQGSVGFYMR